MTGLRTPAWQYVLWNTLFAATLLLATCILHYNTGLGVFYDHQHSPLVSRSSKQASYTTLIQGYVFYTLLDNVKRSDFRYFVLMFDTLGMSMLNHNNIDHINKHHGE